MITLSDTHRLYRFNEIEITAGRSISHTIETGEFFAIKSPSSCRKSTLLNILGTIDRPPCRLYRFGDANLTAIPEAALAGSGAIA